MLVMWLLSQAHGPREASHRVQTWSSPKKISEPLFLSEVYFLCFLDTWVFRAFLLGQNFAQWGQTKPGLWRCLASIWMARLSFLLASWPHSKHRHNERPFPSISCCIIPAITSKKICIHDLFKSRGYFLPDKWYLDTWVLRAFLLGQNFWQYLQLNPELKCLASTWALR